MANKRVRCYAHTLPGVEEIAWLEIRDRLSPTQFVETLFIKDEAGIVVFDYGGNLQNLMQLRTTENVFVQAGFLLKLMRRRSDLGQIHDMVAQAEAFGWAAKEVMRFRAFHQPPSYRIVTRQVGKHPYKIRDVNQAVLAGLAKRLPSWRPEAHGGQVEIEVNLLGSKVLMGMRLSDTMMAKRYQRHTTMQPALRPSLAAALVQLTNPQLDDVFVDPLCGSGTILRERQGFGEYGQLLGGDILHEQGRITWKNNRDWLRRRMPKNLTVLRWDAGYLPLVSGSVDAMATQLPGRQGSAGDLTHLYATFFAEVARVLKGNGRAVFLSSEYDLVKEGMRLVPTLTIETGYSVLADGQWQRVYIATPEQ